MNHVCFKLSKHSLKAAMLKIVSECSGSLLMTGVAVDTTFEKEMHKSISSLVLLLDFLAFA